MIDHPQRGCQCVLHVRRRIKDRTSEKHRARRREYGRAYYKCNSERMIRKAKEWRERNPERFKGLMRRHRLRIRQRRHDERFV